jgi:polysaccharide export outer membrane protein
LTRQLTVLSDGSVSLPFVGTVMAGGRTPAEVTRALVEGLSMYYVEPKVFVSVTPSVAPQVYVEGRVQLPGPKAYRPEFGLADYLGLAGGLTPEASPVVTVVTPRPEGPDIRYVDVSGAARGGSTEVRDVLRPGSIIIVGEGRKVSVAGAVERPGAFDYRPGYRIADYLGEAGGPTSAANLGRARLIRAGESRTVDLRRVMEEREAPENVALQPGDMLDIPERAISGGLTRAQVLDAVLRALTIVAIWD